MDRERFHARARDLRACVALVYNLTKMPGGATQRDFQQVADLMTGAADDLEALIKAQPTGCLCRRVQGENYDYLDYKEGCLHHRQLYVIRESLKAEHRKMEGALKNEVRMKLVTAALGGTATSKDPRDTLSAYARNSVERAIAIADEALRRLTEAT